MTALYDVVEHNLYAQFIHFLKKVGLACETIYRILAYETIVR